MSGNRQKHPVVTPRFGGTTDQQALLCFGSERIRLAVRFGQHDRFRVAVAPDLSITVNAPAGRTIEEVLARARRRTPWILKQVRYFEQFLPRSQAPRYASGETIEFLGRQYRLKIVQGSRADVKLTGRFLWVSAPNRRDRLAVRELVSSWYLERARVTFGRRLDLNLQVAKRYGVREASLRLRRMRRRWGSCGAKGTILLNTELVRAPVHCIDYVIVHELCHLMVAHHGPKFYRLLDRMMPDWRLRKERLERVAVPL
jgi:predicted metal-dependent hydrolase